MPRSGSAVAFAGMARWRVSPAAPAADCDPRAEPPVRPAFTSSLSAPDCWRQAQPIREAWTKRTQARAGAAARRPSAIGTHLAASR